MAGTDDSEPERFYHGTRADLRAGDMIAPGYASNYGQRKQAVCRRIDAIVSKEVPGVCKAIKWNSPLYGMEKDHWFLSFHCFDKYVKVTFFKGGQLEPPPEEKSKYPAIRYHHVKEGDELGEQFAKWVREASKLPGEKM